MQELNEIARLDHWTREALDFEFIRRCRQQAHEKIRWSEHLKDFPAPLRRAANKRLFFSKDMPICSLEDYWLINRFARQFLDQQTRKLLNCRVWKRLRTMGFKMPSIPREIPVLKGFKTFHTSYRFIDRKMHGEV
eukprot:Gregarina_sp_Poly_1__10308@NODE_727_length_6572_cov_47_111145_g545_i0_p6_GENE_NODE_727_length_6572_cov_47_111145_g545_i0NODE_727_length_6572_cov_47_111145_g545_i0_p6_ORF_typecomplete_len135_score12_32PhnJ/PF06007_11/0_084_NODE_727_length_6572_cov_47_111145_g545_i0266670